MTWLLVTAGALGLLAFFEPCTIATHVLFIQRQAQRTPRARSTGLALLWLVRGLFYSGVLTLLVAVTGQWPAAGFLQRHPQRVALGLGLLALVYLASRFVYLPLPHLAVYRLLPWRVREPLRLALTLPACTLPLFAIVAVLVADQGTVQAAWLAGVVFATAFTLPVMLGCWRGLGPAGRELLHKSALASPWLTAALLLAAALALLAHAYDLGPARLPQLIAGAGWSALGLGFLAGFVFSFNPVAFASIPVVLAYVTRAQARHKALAYGTAFVLGMLLTHVLLGVVAALGGDWVKSVMGRQWGLVLGPLLIVLGLLWAGWLRLRLPWIGVRARKITGFWGAFVLGVPFSVAVCPSCTPALVVMLTASASTGSVLFGAGLLLAFALGRSIPLLAGAWSLGWLESLQSLARFRRGFEITAGLLLVLTGLYLLAEYVFVVSMR